MAFWDFLFGKPETNEQVSRYAPWQEQMMQQMGQQGQAGLQNILQNPLDSKAMEDEAMRQYQQQIIPGLMQTLSASPTAGLQRSSAFGQQLSSAGTDLATRLAALRAQVAQQQQSLQSGIYSNMLGQGTQQMFDVAHRPATSGLVGSLAGAMLPGFGSNLATSLFGGSSTPTRPTSSFSVGSGLGEMPYAGAGSSSGYNPTNPYMSNFGRMF